ncbi:MAG: DNA-3-methyladenine glycosylase I [Acidobacteria bacterium]|nr:DNA-3-methyladenine glycosylase I [Acidobacteriota bacterium]
MTSYCDIAIDHPFHGPYHDKEYGFPVLDDNALFERLVLEINQAGLSWLTILKKRDAFREAYAGFDIAKVARLSPEKLLQHDGIIRNRLKVNAAIENAKRLKKMGSFAQWLEEHHPLTKDEWVKLFKKTFVFTGGEITGSFLMSIGYLPGAHDEHCPVYRKALRAGARWKSA